MATWDDLGRPRTSQDELEQFDVDANETPERTQSQKSTSFDKLERLRQKPNNDRLGAQPKKEKVSNMNN